MNLIEYKNEPKYNKQLNAHTRYTLLNYLKFHSINEFQILFYDDKNTFKYKSCCILLAEYSCMIISVNYAIISDIKYLME